MAKKDKIEKTNVIRILDRMKIPYAYYNLGITEAVSGTEAAALLYMAPETVYKTLVAVGDSKEHYVFVIPVEKKLDLKAAAQSVGEKSIRMIPQKELLPLTGYVHGGCSPIGMKKQFQTIVDSSATALEELALSAGKIGCHIRIRPEDLKKAVEYTTAEITDEKEC